MNSEQFFHFLADSRWDAPFFKRLAANDTGNAPGHQGGVAIPVDLRTYFPVLNEELTSAWTPTTDRYLDVEMYVCGNLVATDSVRYQIQTWGGTRSPESRITGQLGPIRNLAHAGDLFVIQRSRKSLESFRFILVRQTDLAFIGVAAIVGRRRWGALDTELNPITQQDLVAAREEIIAESRNEFFPVQNEIRRESVTRSAIARDAAFRDILLGQYQRRCAVSGIALATTSAFEAQAAHVVPLGSGGPDEPRNGILLTGTLHWAFDRGLFGVSSNRRVVVPRLVQAMPENEWLRQYDGRPIGEAASGHLRTMGTAFDWHRQNLLSRWL